MPLQFRLPTASDQPLLERMLIDSFEPVTWVKRVEEQFGPQAMDWRERWHKRLVDAFATQTALVGELDGEIVTYVSGTIDQESRLGYIALLAVDRQHQGRGFGRETLRGMLAYMKELGCVHAHLECLADNSAGNDLFRSEGFQEVARAIRWFIRIP